MLRQLVIKNFTAFNQASLKFCKGLNVIVGENGTGKTHLLKLGYLHTTICDTQTKKQSLSSKEAVERYISERLQNIFKPDKIGNLSRRSTGEKTEVTGMVDGLNSVESNKSLDEPTSLQVENECKWMFQFSSRTEKKVTVDMSQVQFTSNVQDGASVYLPSKEMLSFFDGFLSIYDKYDLQFDETFKDLALKLSSPKLKKKPELIGNLLDTLGTAIGGEVVLEGGRFSISVDDNKNNLEITLLAEGLRKLATLLQLIENGSLQRNGTLFWDEPEANMNPRLIRLIATVLVNLGRNGVQVIVATHSLFLLRELDILIHEKKQTITSRYFALNPTDDGVQIEQGDSIESLQALVLLDEELSQSDRYIEQEI